MATGTGTRPYGWRDTTALTQAKLGAAAGNLGYPVVSHALRRFERDRHTNPNLNMYS